jgi:hypothetical protein
MAAKEMGALAKRKTQGHTGPGIVETKETGPETVEEPNLSQWFKGTGIGQAWQGTALFWRLVHLDAVIPSVCHHKPALGCTGYTQEMLQPLEQ